MKQPTRSSTRSNTNKHNPVEGKKHRHQKGPVDLGDVKDAGAGPRPALPALPQFTNIYDYLRFAPSDLSAAQPQEDAKTEKSNVAKLPRRDLPRRSETSSANNSLQPPVMHIKKHADPKRRDNGGHRAIVATTSSDSALDTTAGQWPSLPGFAASSRDTPSDTGLKSFVVASSASTGGGDYTEPALDDAEVKEKHVFRFSKKESSKASQTAAASQSDTATPRDLPKRGAELVHSPSSPDAQVHSPHARSPSTEPRRPAGPRATREAASTHKSAIPMSRVEYRSRTDHCQDQARAFRRWRRDEFAPAVSSPSRGETQHAARTAHSRDWNDHPAHTSATWRSLPTGSASSIPSGSGTTTTPKHRAGEEEMGRIRTNYRADLGRAVPLKARPSDDLLDSLGARRLG